MTSTVSYKSILPDATSLAATNTATGFSVDNLKTWTEWDQWKAIGSGTLYITIQQSGGMDCNYIAIAGHNLNDEDGVNITVEYSSDNFAGDINTAKIFDVLGDGVIYETFPKYGDQDYWRVKIVTTSINPSLGVLAIGEYTELEKGMRSGFIAPIIDGYRETTSISENGLIIGRSIVDAASKYSVGLRNLTPLWVRDTYSIFLDHAKSKPFFFSWDKDGHLSETMYCWSDGAVSNPSYQDSLYVQHDMSVVGKGNSNSNPVLVDMPLTSSLDMTTGKGSATFTRATVGTYVNPVTGYVTEAAINSPRFEADGILIEGASTNNVFYSEDFSLWSVSAGVTVTVNDALAPDGTTTADRVEKTTGSSLLSVRSNLYAGVSTNYYTASIYVKAGTSLTSTLSIFNATTATEELTWDINWASGVPSFATSPTTETGTSKVEALDNDWYRVSISMDYQLGANDNIRLYFYPAGQGSATGYVYAWGAQQEPLSLVSAYIKTPGADAVSRSADALSIPADGNITDIRGQSSAAACDVKLSGQNIENTQEALRTSGQGLYLIRASQNGNSSVSFYHSGTPIIKSSEPLTSSSRLINSLENTGVSVSTHTAYVNGVVVDTVNGSEMQTPAAATGIYIGSNGGTSQFLYGNIKNLKIYKKRISPSEAANA